MHTHTHQAWSVWLDHADANSPQPIAARDLFAHGMVNDAKAFHSETLPRFHAMFKLRSDTGWIHMDSWFPRFSWCPGLTNRFCHLQNGSKMDAGCWTESLSGFWCFTIHFVTKTYQKCPGNPKICCFVPFLTLYLLIYLSPYLYLFTLWKFNITIENSPLIYLSKWWFSEAM